MPIQLFSPRRIALLGFMVAGLVMLADGVAREELARAVQASLNESSSMAAPLSVVHD